MLESLKKVLNEASDCGSINMPKEYLVRIIAHMEADARKLGLMEVNYRRARHQDLVDALISDLESKGLGWSLDHNGMLIEARIWEWPNVVGRYRPHKTEPLALMLQKAIDDMDKQ